MVRVRENDFRVQFMQIPRGESFDARLRAYGHEDRRRDYPVVRGEFSEACFGLFGSLQEFETVHAAKLENVCAFKEPNVALGAFPDLDPSASFIIIPGLTRNLALFHLYFSDASTLFLHTTLFYYVQIIFRFKYKKSFRFSSKAFRAVGQT